MYTRNMTMIPEAMEFDIPILKLPRNIPRKEGPLLHRRRKAVVTAIRLTASIAAAAAGFFARKHVLTSSVSVCATNRTTSKIGLQMGHWIEQRRGQAKRETNEPPGNADI